MRTGDPPPHAKETPKQRAKIRQVTGLSERSQRPMFSNAVT